MSNEDNTDVLDFINSLPDAKSSTSKPANEKSGSNDDFLEFLDELSAHEKTSKPVGTSKGKFEPRKGYETKSSTSRKSDSQSEAQLKQDTHPLDSQREIDKTQKNTVSQHSDVSAASERSAQNTATNNLEVKNEEEKAEGADGKIVDPLVSISSWWNTEGSSKVSSLWGSLTSNAQQISETTYQLASNTSQQLSHQRQKFLSESTGVADTEQILHITNKLNSILTTMSQQIKDGLIDKEDELMNILLIYDVNNVDYLDSLCALKFNKVMSQVEGGIKTTVSNFNHKHDPSAASGYYDLSLFCGKAIDGEKLCFANLDSSIKDYLKITDLERLQLPEDSSVEHEINKSNIFIAIQPITCGSVEPVVGEEGSEGPSFIEANNPKSFSFTMILKDITNNITIVSKSQPFPLRWARWVAGEHEDLDAIIGTKEGEDAVDPSEWVREWIRDGLGLTFAVLAQEYITKRMGI